MVTSERKQREFERREKEIVSSAYELFRQEGYQSVSIEQIAKRADIGKGTVYKHFQSKEEIAARIIIDINQQAESLVAETLDHLPFRERLDKLVDLSWSVNMQETNFLTSLIAQMIRGDFFNKLSEPMQKAYAEMRDQHNQLYVDLIQQAIDDGEVIPVSAEGLLFSVSAVLDGVLFRAWLMLGAGLDIKNIEQTYMQEIKDFIYRGIKNPAK